jgi:predicted ATPase
VIHLRCARFATPPGSTGFPFNVPAVRSLRTLEFPSPVTFFVGENGSGKSTVLEALAIATRRTAIGSAGVHDDPTLEPQRRLGRAIKLVWNRWNDRGFFLRAEDFFGFAKQLSRLRAELNERLAEIGEEYDEHSAYARGLAEAPVRASLADMERRYGRDLDARSHGEAFLKLFGNRFVPGGLYLLDEPEAALSPQSQLGLLAMLDEMVGKGAQFIVATHSPILLGFPGATIYNFDLDPVAAVAYADLEQVALTRDFLNQPERFLRHLQGDEVGPAGPR